jgi:hypothetical protein
MDLVPLDEKRQLFISPSIDDWKSIEDYGITAVLDLDGDLDLGIPNIPNHMLYVYFPIFDAGLPDLNKLHALAKLGAHWEFAPGMVVRGLESYRDGEPCLLAVVS